MSTDQENLDRWRIIFRRLFDPSGAHAVLLNLEGVIVETNVAWRRFARNNGIRSSYEFIGVNYLDACEPLLEEATSPVMQAYVGLQEVVRTYRPKFTMVYPCHSPREKRWFRMWVEAQLPSVPAIVVAHYLVDPPASYEGKKNLDGSAEVTCRAKTMH